MKMGAFRFGASLFYRKKKAMAKADKNLAREAAKQAKREEKRKEQRAKDIAEGRLVENGRTEIQRPENKGRKYPSHITVQTKMFVPRYYKLSIRNTLTLPTMI